MMIPYRKMFWEIIGNKRISFGERSMERFWSLITHRPMLIPCPVMVEVNVKVLVIKSTRK